MWLPWGHLLVFFFLNLMSKTIIILVLSDYVQLPLIEYFSIGFFCLLFFFLLQCFAFNNFMSIVNFYTEKLILITSRTCKSFLSLKTLPLHLLICYNFIPGLSFYCLILFTKTCLDIWNSKNFLVCDEKTLSSILLWNWWRIDFCIKVWNEILCISPNGSIPINNLANNSFLPHDFVKFNLLYKKYVCLTERNCLLESSDANWYIG